MESVEESDLWQMVNDFIETESASPDFCYQAAAAAAADASFNCSHGGSLLSRRKFIQLQEILNNNNSSTDEEARVLEIVMTHMRNRKMELKKTTTKLKRRLVICIQRNGFNNASLCRTRWPSSSSCTSGEYEFVDIIIEQGGHDEDGNGNGHHQRLIVDVDFQSQFEVARPTKTYSELWSYLPQIFVGSETKLRKIIELMCSAAEESMKHRGLHVPPWRRSAYMLSKWLSNFTVREEEGEGEEKTMIRKKKLARDHVNSLTNDPPLMMVFAMKPANETDRRRRIAAAGSGGLAGYFSSLSINCC